MTSQIVLRTAAIYNLVWGAWVILFPNHFFELVGMQQPLHGMIWQGMGMVIGVYGLGIGGLQAILLLTGRLLR